MQKKLETLIKDKQNIMKALPELKDSAFLKNKMALRCNCNHTLE